MPLAKFAVLAGLALLLAGCASSTPYLEHGGAYKVVTEPPAAGTEAPTAKTRRRQDAAESAQPVR